MNFQEVHQDQKNQKNHLIKFVNKIYNEIKLKKFQKKDLKNFNKYYFLYLNEISKKSPKKENFYINIIKKTSSIFWVKKKNLTLGFIVLYLNEYDKISLNNIYIRDIYIKLKYRKKKFATNIVYKIESIYSKKFFHNINIDILNSNLKVIRFWKKIGFKKKGKKFFKKI